MENLRNEYPIDTEALAKGSKVNVETIEKAFGVKRGSDEYSMAALRCGQYIARRFLDRGEVVTITQRKHDLVILTDDEMPAHNARLFQNDIRAAARVHARMLGGDRSKMSEQTIALYDRTVQVQGAQLAAVSQAKRTFTLRERERQTPALLKAKG